MQMRRFQGIEAMEIYQVQLSTRSLAQSATAAAAGLSLSPQYQHRVRNPRAPTRKATMVDSIQSIEHK
jgi:hypothetical protein